MAKLTRIKLTHMTPLHIGVGRDSYDVAATALQSDMLSAALASIRAMHGKGESTKQFLESFVLSSAFPYDGGEFFLPRMKGLLPIKVRGLEEKDYRKKLKKLAYISAPVWLQLAEGKDIDVDDAQLHGAYLLSEGVADYTPPTMQMPTERVAVSRTGEEDAMPFAFNWTFIKPGAGLYCLLQAGEAATEEVITLFKELGSIGIGSDKTVGGGQFEVETDKVELADIQSGKQMLLSTYIPTPEELGSTAFNSSNYQLIHRGGFMAGSTNENLRHLRKKTIYMFDTGSVLATNMQLEGKVVDIAPEWNTPDMHPVYRSGRPLAIHITLK